MSLDGNCKAVPEQGCECGDGECTQDTLNLSPGFWRAAPTSTIVHACPWAEACQGGSDYGIKGSGYCTMGYTGPLCAVCTKQTHFFNPDSESCDQCPTGGQINWFSVSMLVLDGLVVIGAVFLVYMVYNAQSLKKRALSSKQKIEENKKRLDKIIQKFQTGPAEKKVNQDGSVTVTGTKTVQKQSEKKSKQMASISFAAMTTHATTMTVVTEVVEYETTYSLAAGWVGGGGGVSGLGVSLKSLTAFTQS